MILNLKNQADDLPGHLRNALVGLENKSFAALRNYVGYMGIKPGEISRIIFDEGFGDISSKCGWASGIAEEFDCVVEFQHNRTPAVCYPTTIQAAYASWSEERGE